MSLSLPRASGSRSRLTALAVAVGGLALYLGGLAQVPFHPDESTYLFMSRDFATVFLQRDPAALAWSPEQALAAQTRYRLLDAPLPRYLIGLGWWSRGYAAAELNQDWAWDQSWQANRAAGRLPAPELLWAARLPAAALGALAAALAYCLGVALGGPAVGLGAALLLGLNPLMLLHARRAMAEGSLLFTSVLAVLGGLGLAWAVDGCATPNARRLGWAGAATGALIGLAACSKHNGAVLAAAVLAAAGLAVWQKPWTPGQRLGALAVTGLALAAGALAVFAALNPVLWRDPAGAVRLMATLRADLIRRQTQQLGQLAPALSLPTPADRLRATVLELFLRPPAVWDVAAADHLGLLQPQADAYFTAPLHRTSVPLGAALAGLTTAGAAFSALRLARDRCGPATRAEQALWSWTLVTLAFTLFALPFDWQRYFLPLLPPVCLFAALGAQALAAPLLRRFGSLSGIRHEPTV